MFKKIRHYLFLLLFAIAIFLPTNPAQAASTTIVVNARGTPTADCLLFLICSYTYPKFDVYVNGSKVGSTKTVTNSNQDYTFSNVTVATTGNINIDVHFINDLYCSIDLFDLIIGCNGDRNLIINSVKIGNETISPTGQTVDAGSSYSQATDGINTYNYSGSLYENSALRLSTTFSACCAASLIAEYRFEETTPWNGSLNELKDSAGYSGGPYDGQGIGNPKPTMSTNGGASGSISNGTCGYAELSGPTNNGGAFTLDNLPISTSNGNKTSVSFWMYWDGTTQTIIPVGWHMHYLIIINNRFGFGTYNSDLYGVSSSNLNTGWNHIVAVFTNGNVSQNKLYINGVQQSLSQLAGSPNNSRAYVQSTLVAGGHTYNTIARYVGKLDELKVYNGELTQSGVTTNYNESRLCPGFLPPVDNLALTATLDTSHVSPWENLDGVNDNVTTTSSSVLSNGSAEPKIYGNWIDASYNGTTNWVSFEWPTSKTLTAFEVFWWDDTAVGGDGIRQPTTATIDYWNGSTWISVGNIGTALDTFNHLDLSNIVTKKIRVSMSSTRATGIIEARIFGTEGPAYTLIGEYHLDEASWTGSPNEVIDTAGYTGGPYHGSTTGSPLPNANHVNRAIAGSTGTCGYAELNGPTSGGGAFNFSSIPFDTSGGATNSISLWLFWDGTDQVVPFSSNGYQLLISGNTLGFSSNGIDLYGVNIAGHVNSWIHVAATFKQGDYTQNKIYINGTNQTLSQQVANTRVLKTFYDMANHHSGANWEYSTNIPSPWFSDNPNGEVEYGRSDFFGISGPLRSILELERGSGDASNLKANVSTTPGEIVYVSFDHADRGGYLSSDFEVYIDNQLVGTVNQASASFVHYEYSAVTTSATTLVELRATDTADAHGPTVDDIKIETGTGMAFNSQATLGGQSASTNKRFVGRIDELKFYTGEINQSQVTADYNATHSCPSYVVNVDAHDFNCIAEQEASLNAGHLYMQLAGQPFNIKVIALKNDGTAETTFSAASDKTVTLEFLDQTQASSPIVFNDGSNVSSKTLTFTTSNTTGIVAVNNLIINNAYRNLRCRITDANQSPTLAAISYDNFSVRPLEFTLSSNANADSTGTNANATPTVVAGNTFTIYANTNTPGYNYAPQFDNTKRNAHAGAPKKGFLSGTFLNANSTTGNAIGSDFVYDEVGYVKINTQGVYDDSFTAVDSGSGDCLDSFSNVASAGKYGCKFRNNTQSDFFGRFIPNHFDVGGGSRVTTAQCGSQFTYYGQDGLTTQFEIRAENLSGSLVRNYHGAYAKLDVNSWTDTSSPTGLRFLATNLPSGVTLSASATSTTGSWNEGLANVTAKHQLSRPASPVAEVNLAMEMDAIDSDGVGADDGTPESINVASNALFRYGALSMTNVYGSELLPLLVPIEAQYWDGATYRKNTLDSCSSIQAANVTMNDYQKDLAACETTLSSANIMSAGEVSLQLTAPGSGNSGSVTLTPNLTSASGNTCIPNSTTATPSNNTWFGNNNPAIKATFGLHKTPVIYMHERF